MIVSVYNGRRMEFFTSDLTQVFVNQDESENSQETAEVTLEELEKQTYKDYGLEVVE